MSKRPRLRVSPWMLDYLRSRERVIAIMDQVLEKEASLMLRAFHERLAREVKKKKKR